MIKNSSLFSHIFSHSFLLLLLLHFSHKFMFSSLFYDWDFFFEIEGREREILAAWWGVMLRMIMMMMNLFEFKERKKQVWFLFRKINFSLCRFERNSVLFQVKCVFFLLPSSLLHKKQQQLEEEAWTKKKSSSSSPPSLQRSSEKFHVGEEKEREEKVFLRASHVFPTSFEEKEEKKSPTSNGAMQNGSSAGICMHCIHVFARLAQIFMLSRCLLTKLLHRSSVGSLLRVRSLLVGRQNGIHTECPTCLHASSTFCSWHPVVWGVLFFLYFPHLWWHLWTPRARWECGKKDTFCSLSSLHFVTLSLSPKKTSSTV